MTTFCETGCLQFESISDQANREMQGLTPIALGNFLVFSDILEGAFATGRLPAVLTEEIDDDLFVLNGTALGGTEKFICACRGRRILVAAVVTGGRSASEGERGAAREALDAWERANAFPG